MAFKETLLQLRTEQGLSQMALAEQLDVTRQTISRWETGAAFPSTEKLILLAQVFRVSVDTLANGKAAIPDAAETEEEPAEVQPPKEEPAPAKPRSRKRLAIAVCALGLLVVSCIGIYFFAVRGRGEDAVPIEETESEEVDISDWVEITLTPLEP